MELNFEQAKKTPLTLTTKLTYEEETKTTPAPGKEDFFSHTESGPQSQTTEQPQQKGQEYFQQTSGAVKGELFPAKLVVEMADWLVSKALSGVLEVTTKQKISAVMISATKHEKEMIEPALKAWLDSLNFQMTPLNALLVTIGLVYGSKAIDLSRSASAIKGGQETPRMASEPKETIPMAATGRKPVIKNGEMSSYMKKKITKR